MDWLSEALQPLVLVWLMGLGLLVSLWRRRQERRRRLAVLTAVYLVLTILCLPAVNYLALGSLEWRYRPLAHRPEDVQAIVVLAGSVRIPDTRGLPALPGEDTVFRCLRAAEMYRQGRPCPVVVSGGPAPGMPSWLPPARVMRDFLVGQGVAQEDILEEGVSESTYENAVQTATLLKARGLHRVLLVTSAYHLQRAVGCFRKQGLDVVPCGCHYRAHRLQPSLAKFLPNPAVSRDVATALHEWLGLGWYALCGRV